MLFYHKSEVYFAQLAENAEDYLLVMLLKG